ncbi:MAG TPA: HAD-IA family hydrolase [Acidimicrobiia bacterium]
MLPDAVLFDLYDTLITSDWRRHATFVADALGVTAEALADAYRAQRESLDRGQLTDAAAVIAGLAARCGVELTPNQVAEVAAAEADFLRQNVVMYDDTLTVIRQLAADGVRTAIVSNCSPTTRAVVDHFDLEAEVDALVLSFEVGAAKPDPEIYEVALGRVGAEPGRSWFIDDRGDYLDGARRLGIRTVRIARFESFGEDVPGGDHPVIERLDGLFELF